MKASLFYCPHCKQANACDCEACKPSIQEGEPVAGHTDDGEGLICPGCGKTYSYDQALDTEWELLKQQSDGKTPSN